MSSVAAAIAPAQNSSEIPRKSLLLRGAGTVVLCTLVIKVIATSKEFVVAGAYGRSDALDAFLAASLVPALLINLIAESMSQALIPTLVRIRLQRGSEAARQLLTGQMLRLTLLLISGCLISAATAPWWIRCVGWNFSEAKLRLTLRIFLALLPVVLLGGIAANCAAVLNAARHYLIAAISPVAIPICTVAGVLYLGGHAGVSVLVGAALVGAGIQLGISWSAMSRAGYAIHSAAWSTSTPETNIIQRNFGVIAVSSIVASGGLLVDQAMASSLAPGSVSTLAFAGRFVSVVMTLMAAASSSVLGPHLATLTAQQNWDVCRKTLRSWTRLAWAISIPTAVALAFSAPWLVRVFLQHGQFQLADTKAVAPVLALSALQIPFFAVSRVHYRFILAMRRSSLLLKCGIMNLALDILLNLILIRPLGVAGIALSTSLWTVATWAFLALASRRLLATAASQDAVA